MFIYKENSFSKERRTKKKGEKPRFSIIFLQKSLIFRDSSDISHIIKRRVYIKKSFRNTCEISVLSATKKNEKSFVVSMKHRTFG